MTKLRRHRLREGTAGMGEMSRQRRKCSKDYAGVASGSRLTELVLRTSPM